MAEKSNPTQEQKREEQQVNPTIKIAEYDQEIKTEKIHAQRLPMESETTPLLKNEIPWVDYDWAQNDWGVNYYSWGMPIPTQWGNAPETQNKGNQKGGNMFSNGQT